MFYFTFLPAPPIGREEEGFKMRKYFKIFSYSLMGLAGGMGVFLAWQQNPGPTRLPAGLSSPGPLDLPLGEVLKESSFNVSLVSELRVESEVIPYDPMLVSVIASTRSRSPKISQHRWQKQTLKPVENNPTCPGDFNILFKPSLSGSPYTFVIFPSLFSELSSGAFFNQTAHILAKTFDDPNLVAFDGYLSPSFLKGGCRRIPWNIHTLARDIHLRLTRFFESVGLADSQKGLIGFSGGASIVIALLGQDGLNSRSGKVFDLGGLGFSPLLHIRTTFDHLDRQRQLSSIPHQGLTTLEIKNVSKFFMTSLFNMNSPLWVKVLKLYRKNPEEFIDRAFNELTIVDLKNMLEALNLPVEDNHLSYYNTFVFRGFQESLSSSVAPEEDLDRLFDEATDLTPSLQAIKAPLFVYFSQDDPFVSYNNTPLHSDILKVLEVLSGNPHITLFHPQFGGHTGALLDSSLEDLLFSFFYDSENPVSL